MTYALTRPTVSFGAARAYDRAARPEDFFKAWHKALSVDPWASDRNVWPVFCVTIQHPSIPDTPRLSINQERQRVTSLAHGERMNKRQQSSEISQEQAFEMEKMAQYQTVRRTATGATDSGATAGVTTTRVQNQYDKLMNVIDAIRTLECTPKFVGDRNHAMHAYHEKMIAESTEVRDYSFINFAYGMVFYHGFHRLFTTHPVAVDAVQRSRGRQLDWISFGSNVGTETFYAAMTWNLNSVGYDVLCSLVDHSQTFRTQFHLESKTMFHCKDALDADLSNAGIIWIDNQSWDEHLTNSIYVKLNQDMIPGAIVIEYAMSDFHAGSELFLGDKLDVVGCSKLEVSWDNKAGTTISIFQKREAGYSGNYYDWSDFGYLLRKRLKSIRRMIDDVGMKVLNGPLTILAKQNEKEEKEAKEDHQPGQDQAEELLNLMEELQNLEIIAREDPTVLSSVQFTDRILNMYSTVLFNWYHTNTFKLATTDKTSSTSTSNNNTGSNRNWSRSEIQYLRTFAALSGKEFRAYNLNGQWIGNRMAGYSYSHTFDTTDDTIVVSSRARIGTTINFKELWTVAKQIIQERGLILDEKIIQHLNENNGHGPLYSFHGLGWDDGDEKEKHFKIFIMYHSYHALKEEYTTLSGPGISEFCLDHGLLSFVYKDGNSNNKNNDKNSESIETRLIMYPKDVNDAKEAGLDVPAYTGTTALMFTTERGLIPMYDLERNRLCAWYSQFPTNAAYVVDKWTHIGGNLETVSYVSDTKFALYFPSVSA